MILQISLITLALGLVSTVGGQSVPQPELIDEFGQMGCDEMLSRIDNFAVHLQHDPTSTAVITIYPPQIYPHLGGRRLRLISSTLQLRGIEEDRYTFRRNPNSPDGQIRTKLWKLPPGAVIPEDDLSVWNEEPPVTDRAHVFGYVDDIDICPSFVPKKFAKLILNNPESKGHVVVITSRDMMWDKYKLAETWISELAEKHGIPRKRLRLFFSKGSGAGVEFWFVPQKKQ